MRRIVEAKELATTRTTAIARWLLGKHLVRHWPDGREEARLIVETEAYRGEEDRACHARAGRTARTAVMYGPAGGWYVYLCYGIHEMLNLVVGPEGFPAAILIRGVEGAVGPGRVTKQLGIGRALNATPAVEARAGAPGVGALWIEDRGVRVPRREIAATPRIGIDFAGPVWAAKPWRLVWRRFVPPRAVRQPDAARARRTSSTPIAVSSDPRCKTRT
jgi:DNA-3-methyladenine glycosylase